MEDNFEKKLHQLAPDRLSEGERERAWMSIVRVCREHQDALESSWMHRMKQNAKQFFNIGFPKLGMVALVMALIITTSGVAAAFADESKPGDFLFPIDIATENVRLALSIGEKKDELRLKFSSERLEEAEVVINLVALQAKAFEARGNKDSSDVSSLGSGAVTVSSKSGKSAFTAATAGKDATGTIASQEGNQTTQQNTRTPVQATFSPTSIAAADAAIDTALAYLRKNKAVFETNGNIAAANAVADIVAKLEALALDYANDLDDLSVRIKENNSNTKIEIVASSQNIKTKFKLSDNGRSERGNTSSSEVKISSSKNGESISVKGNGTKVEFKSSERKENGRNGNGRDDDDDEQDHKISICHKGNSITVARAALPAHLKHGDTRGRCGGNGGNGTTTPDTIAPIISNLSAVAGTATATVTWMTNEKADSMLWYGTSSPFSLGTAIRVSQGSLMKSHSISLSGLKPNTVYRYLVASKDVSGNRATSTQTSFTTRAVLDAQAPSITNLSATTGTSTAIVSWNTNENANSILWYGTSSPFLLAQALRVTKIPLVQSHSISLTGLVPNTLFRYIVVSRDASGNTATSTQTSFTTDPLPPADVTAPTISSVLASDIASTTATISWTTNELATSKLYLGTTTPLPLNGTTLYGIHTAFVTNHSFSVSGLTASTTYRFRVGSIDSLGNSATSTEFSFNTL